MGFRLAHGIEISVDLIVAAEIERDHGVYVGQTCGRVFLYLSIGLPVLLNAGLVGLLILYLNSRLDAVNIRLDAVTSGLRETREDTREIRSDVKLLTGKVYEMTGQK
jgi:hypothetical protein